MKRSIKHFLKKEEMGAGGFAGPPTNNASGNQIAGLGSGPNATPWGDPVFFLFKKKKYSKIERRKPPNN